MKKLIISIIFLISGICSFGQSNIDTSKFYVSKIDSAFFNQIGNSWIVTGSLLKVDTVFNEGFYKSYFNKSLKVPLYCTDSLYQGGGTCSRKGMYFTGNYLTATSKDYAASGYDEGHLVDAKDYAFDCVKEKTTFKFYNALPQTPALNRGIWKHYETLIRKLSQTTHLFIIAGGIFNTNKTIGNGVAVPDLCYKIVYDNTGKLLYCLLFPNDNSQSVKSISIDDLNEILGYQIVF